MSGNPNYPEGLQDFEIEGPPGHNEQCAVCGEWLDPDDQEWIDDQPYCRKHTRRTAAGWMTLDEEE